MTNRSKAKGTAWETEIVNYLRDHGFPFAERRALSGNQDKGDVAGVPGVVIEAKNCKDITLGSFMSELEVEQARAEAPVGLLVIKRRMKSVDRSYAVMPFAQAVELIR